LFKDGFFMSFTHRYSRHFIAALLLWLVGVVGSASAQTLLVKPYVQPGDGSELRASDVKVICWLTDQTPGTFAVEYDLPAGGTRTVEPVRVALNFAAVAEKKTAVPVVGPPHPGEKEQRYFKYAAYLKDLPFNAEITYRVKLGKKIVREAAFKTRATAEQSIRFVMVGDLAKGKESQNVVAYQIAQQKPQFMVVLGDMVYPKGRVSEYMLNYWHTYSNTDVADPKVGSSLMASVPFYALLGNHDVDAKYPAISDALGAYYFFHPPQNGPGEGPWNTPLGSDKEAVARFRAANGDSYPSLDNYSFDYGPAHFVILNSNLSGSVHEAKLRQWLERSLKNTKARWKFVCFHAPPFHSTPQHYTSQAMRLWQPLFEQAGVDMVFAGHVHNYQRTWPMQFAPSAPKRDAKGLVHGKFTLDRTFDGSSNTQPKGVIHIVAGGGGATLYGPGLDKSAESLRKQYGDNYGDYTAKMIADRHTFVQMDLSPLKCELRAIDDKGQTVDAITINKPAK